MRERIAKRATRLLVALLTVALLLSLVSAFGNRRFLLSKMKANEKTCTLSRLDFPPVGPQLFLPAAGGQDQVLQTFISHHTVLSGIEIGLIPLPSAPRVSGTLTLFDARGAVLRTVHFDEEGFTGGVLRIPFEPVAHPRGANFSFSSWPSAAGCG